jgi:CDP-diacylglycerol--glycerol-3-phosphate 3-phosphatidyltransferase
MVIIQNMLTIPNLITFVRIILVPFFIYLLWHNIYDIPPKVVILFLAIIGTDALDGFTARLRKETSVVGSFIDPLADKLFFIPTFVIFYLHDHVSYLVFFTYIVREILMIAGWIKIYTARKNIKPVVRLSGKVFTIAEAIFILLILTKVDAKIINYASGLFVIITIYSVLDNIMSAKKIFYETT